ncbi:MULTISPECIES: 30S ribosomal protein S4 [Haloarcula]|uniref:Small ribosomal subunit protein uS4 n=1 Tax=Haloarcula pellucida TaxID=1427151 RepID=A0A830GIN4_9EURY|nr:MULTISPECIES: 30S ribosomal protein S4 [Halomicroarcula]MBX0347822.1 30S ribosomal protein S4 [Halomicroarcula pellucida]MDS0276244.1 30S ribosomal protein S4 [Halomicroarcula sp. S1AR25-4]GGN90454.1 30S ribosomal protein S4 [Halomicroarcula pellucida]
MALGSNTKFYETPNHPFQGERIADESNLLGRYGLKNKEELWRAQSELRGYRREARKLLGQTTQTDEADEFLARLKRYGILSEQDTLDDVLSLAVTDVLERRLQTVVYRKGYANTPEQARQFIVHGHIVLGGQRVTRPSMKVEVAVEDTVGFDENSSLADELHPERAEAQE